jgi:apolipoprotein N-acyltransferase
MKGRDSCVVIAAGTVFWQKILVALLTAGLLWLAFPGGGGFWPLLFIALIPLLLAVIHARTVRQASVYGVLTGLFHFLVLLYWLVTVLSRYGGLPPFLSIPALVLLALYMSLYMGVFALLAHLFFVRLPWQIALWVVPCLWVALDWCRSFLFTGFPWMDPGYALANVPWLIQSADLWGHYGLSYCLVLINTLMAMLFLSTTRKRGQLTWLVPVLLVCSVVALYSSLRWQQIGRQMQASETMRIGVVQGNIAQDLKWSPDLQKETLANYIGQSRGLIERSHPLLVVWPETALPFYPVAHPLLQSVRDLAIQGQISLLTGSPWVEQDGGSGDGDNQKLRRYYNSALLFDASGQITSKYSKSHLVPFGEYVPLKKFLPFLAPVVEAIGDFSPGVIQSPLACQNARIGVLICFESIFPDIARKWVGVKANILVNLTNDAWYGRSSAPYHSLAMTVLRAVETRRSLVRAANTGFSGFVDPLGRMRMVSPLFEPWAESADVVLMDEETWFVRWGYLFAPLCLGVVMFFLTWIVLRNPRSRHFSEWRLDTRNN